MSASQGIDGAITPEPPEERRRSVRPKRAVALIRTGRGEKRSGSPLSNNRAAKEGGTADADVRPFESYATNL